MSSLSLAASPFDEPEVQKGAEALPVAAGIVEDVMGQALHQIRLKQLDVCKIPSAIQFSGEIFGHTIQGFGFQYDERVDDHIITAEQVETEAPPPSTLKVPPWETAQQSACFDFAPPEADKLAGLNKFFQPARDPSILLSEASAQKPRSGSRAHEDDGTSASKRGSAYKSQLSIKKTIATWKAKAQRAPSGRKRKEDDADEFHKPVALTKEDMCGDKAYERNVEIMRQQLARRDVKDQFRSAMKGAFRPRPSQMSFDEESVGPVTVDFTNLTFDDQGNALEIRPCKVERLPRLMGPSAQVREVKAKKKSSVGLRSRPQSHAASREDIEASRAAGKPPI